MSKRDPTLKAETIENKTISNTNYNEQLGVDLNDNIQAINQPKDNKGKLSEPLMNNQVESDAGKTTDNRRDTAITQKGRESKTFNPKDTRSAFHSKRKLGSRWFGALKEYSLRRGSIGVISAILGTGILVLPNGIASFGWAGSLVAMIVSACCHVFSYYLFSSAQGVVRLNDFSV